jgi:hypothetical protein
MRDELRGDAIARLMADLAGAELGDPRRVARAQRVTERLAKSPQESLPTALVTDAELEAAYRFFNNDEVTFEQLLAAHADAVAERAASRKVVLAIHDTTTCAFPHADPEEVGYLPTGKAGLLLHLTLLVDTQDWRRPLGIVHGEPIRRTQKTRRRRKSPGTETAKWANKESERWLRGVLSTEKRLTGKAAVIHIADRESDQYALLSAMAAAKQRFIVRARHDRCVVDADRRGLHIRHLVERAEPRLEREVPLTRRLAKTAPVARRNHPPREGRLAKLRFATTVAELRGPQYYTGTSTSTTVNVVHVSEVDAPAGQEPVDWLLYTTEPIGTLAEIATVVDYYRCRWLIEELNKALKTGCVVQDRQLESYDALVNMLALSLPIAVELLALRSLARVGPDRPATDFLSRGQLAALRHLSHRPVPGHPTVKDVLWCIAGLGGHIKNNGPPGWQVLQRGMDKFLPFAAGWCARGAADL